LFGDFQLLADFLVNLICEEGDLATKILGMVEESVATNTTAGDTFQFVDLIDGVGSSRATMMTDKIVAG
jgi:hypothetical protein